MRFGLGFLDSLSSFKKAGRRRFSPEDIARASQWQEGFLPKEKQTPGLVRLNSPRSNFVFLFLLLVFLFGALHTRLFELQIIKGESSQFLADSNRYRHITARPPRGRIYSADGELLAYDKPGFRVVVELSQISNSVDYTPILSLLQLTEDSFQASIDFAKSNGYPVAVLVEGLDQETSLKIETIKASFPGVNIEISPLREYTYPEVYAPILGYVSEISDSELSRLSKRGYSGGSRIGKVGLEKFYEDKLRGAPGEQIWELNSSGERLRQISVREARSGLDLHLSVNHSLQIVTYNALQKALKDTSAGAGGVVVQDVKTGQILSLVSLPTYNNNLFSQGLLTKQDYQDLLNNPMKPLFNRVIQGEYPPGSTFKLVMATAALSENIVTPETVIIDNGAIAVGSFLYRCWKPGGHGPQTIVDALSNSCDVYFYTIGGGYQGQPGLGVSKIAEWARKFGLGASLNSDLPSEKGGLVPDSEWKLATKEEKWYIGNTYHISIGQGDLLATPLQINAVTTAVVNGGTLFEPRLAKDSTVVLRKGLASEETFRLVREGMRKAVTEGTAYPLRVSAYTSAGKTGTSETGDQDKTHAWFTCFAPYEEPEVSVTVFLENGGEGSHDAAPVAKQILDYYFK